MAHSIHVEQKFEDYQASLSPNRWHDNHTYLSSLEMLGTTRLNLIFFADHTIFNNAIQGRK